MKKYYLKNLDFSTKYVFNFLNKKFLQKHLKFIVELGKLSSKLGYNLYVVGGFVRDLFLYRNNQDIDLVIEGNAIQLAKIYAKKNNVKLYIYEKFCTASIRITKGFKIDITSSRLEYYKNFYFIPSIEISSIRNDLERRDFSINSLAIQLNLEKFGLLLDFFSARKDLKNGTLRVLHNRSFIDDPCRVFRVLRFKERFNLNIDIFSSFLFENIIKNKLILELNIKKVFNEILYIFDEENSTEIITRLFDCNILNTFLPGILNKRIIELFLNLTKLFSYYQYFYFRKIYYKKRLFFLTIMTSKSSNNERYYIYNKIGLSKKYIEIFYNIYYNSLF